MITYANLQQSVAAWLLSHPGQRIRINIKQFRLAGIRDFYEFETWMEKHGLQSKSDGADFLTWHGELPPPDPSIPPPGTPIDQIHPGNRFRVMFGQPLLPQPPTDGHQIHDSHT